MNKEQHPMPHPPVGATGAARMRGQTFTIASAFFIVTIPLLLLDAVLVGIAAMYAEPGSLKALRTAILINIDAARFAAISSWSSTVVSIISPFLIVLASYPSSRSILKSMRSGAFARLPTPYQLATMVEIRTGSTFASVWRLLKYWTSYRGKRSSMSSSLVTLVNTVILGFVLSLLVFATDTWLHLAITSENIFHYSPSAGVNLSFALLPRCLQNNNSYAAQSNFYNERKQGDNSEPCTLNPAVTNTFLLSSPINPLRALNNLSSVALVKRHDQDGRTYQYMGPSDMGDSGSQDYTAYTYGMSSKCSPRSKKCNLGDGMFGASTPFNCTSSGFSGEMQTAIQVQYYSDPDLSASTSYGIKGFYNPFYFIAVAHLPSQWPAPSDDPEIITEVHRDRAMIMNCSTTVYDITYSVRNGSIVDFSASKSNISVTNALESPMGYTVAANGVLQQALSFAGFSNSAQGMLDVWAPEYDRAAMAMSVTALQGAPAIEAQYREPKIVARVPLAPFVCLLMANFLFALFGVLLALIAAVAGRDPETQEIVERMTAVGVVANYFESPQQAQGKVQSTEMMFEELTAGNGKRVTLAPTQQGGYSFLTRG